MGYINVILTAIFVFPVLFHCCRGICLHTYAPSHRKDDKIPLYDAFRRHTLFMRRYSQACGNSRKALDAAHKS